MRLSKDPTRAFGLNAWRAAWGIWILSFAAMTGSFLVVRWKTFPYGVYVGAAQRWLAHEPLYYLGDVNDFHYLPTSALLFTPLVWLGSPLGDVLWRVLGWATCALGVWRLSRMLMPAQPREGFFLASALAVGPAISNLFNGQANLLIGALALHATADLIEKRFWRAAAMLSLGVALKPLMVVPFLLAWVLYRAMWLRAPAALFVALALPFLFRDHEYVLAQYRDCFTRLGQSASPAQQFEDLRGLLATLGWDTPQATHFLLRGLAAAGVLGVCIHVRRSLTEPALSFYVTSFAMTYLMLFNPRSLTSSYVMSGCVAALLGAVCILQRRKAQAWSLVAILFAWTLHFKLAPFIEHWLRPLGALAFAGVLLRDVYERRASPSDASRARST